MRLVLLFFLIREISSQTFLHLTFRIDIEQSSAEFQQLCNDLQFSQKNTLVIYFIYLVLKYRINQKTIEIRSETEWTSLRAFPLISPCSLGGARSLKAALINALPSVRKFVKVFVLSIHSPLLLLAKYSMMGLLS
ncbi:hypothetical protein PENTCL1PPCAC_12717 [Pristionchus entomophagus]|uniref:G protein-coupled receptor n=1 Tax=Pristionchus entomophagus TaxID=358040 RepID=A0AAV5T820_9BILA|nr:hypothetical protein PENTCL1PPCAC_12717 [Pristionchus entomophagus]